MVDGIRSTLKTINVGSRFGYFQLMLIWLCTKMITRSGFPLKAHEMCVQRSLGVCIYNFIYQAMEFHRFKLLFWETFIFPISLTCIPPEHNTSNHLEGRLQRQSKRKKLTKNEKQKMSNSFFARLRESTKITNQKITVVLIPYRSLTNIK